MKKFIVPAAVIAAMALLTACDKDDKPSGSTLSKIQAKWKVTSIHVDAGEEDSTYTGIAADYVDFRTDGKVYTSIADGKDTSLYSVVGSNKLVIDGDTADIKQLTGSQLVFEGKESIITDTVTTTFTLAK